MMPRIAVIGDALLDVYYDVEPAEWDAGIEAPAYQIVAGHTCLGGAANVAAAVSAAGGDVSLYAVLGRDEASAEVDKLLQGWAIDRSGIAVSDMHATRVLSRLMGKGASLPLRFDYSGTAPLNHEVSRRPQPDKAWSGIPKPVVADHDGVIVADYGGLLSRRAAEDLIEGCRELNVPVFVDPSRGTLQWYRGCDIVKINLNEVQALYGETYQTISGLRSAADNLRRACDARVAVITLGERGAMAVNEAGQVVMPNYVARSVLNTTGGGDAFAAGFMLGYCRQRDLEASVMAALEIASRAVSTQCTCPTRETTVEATSTTYPDLLDYRFLDRNQKLAGVNRAV